MLPSPLPGPFYDPLRAQQRADLQHDRHAVLELSATVEAELLPAAASECAPGWRGPASRAFDLRREQLLAQLRRAAAGLDEANAALTVALLGLGEWP